MRSICISKSFRTAAARPSARVLETAAMFGLGVDEERELDVVRRCEIPLPAPGIVFVTGPSGSGKSTILSLIGSGCEARGERVIRFDDMPALTDVALVDAIGSSLENATSLLSLAGLGDAFVMLRRPCELSDGQRYRLKMAHAMEMAQRADGSGGPGPAIILADEFGATLDRLTAKTMARNARRWIDRSPDGCTLICATTHDDLLEALRPEVLVWKGLGDEMEVVVR